jgi:hypothetical protein
VPNEPRYRDFRKRFILKRILRITEKVLEMTKETQDAIDELRVQVQRNTSVTQGVQTLIGNLASQIEQAADDPEEVRSLAAELRTSTDALAQAVQANTPTSTQPEQPSGQPTPTEPAPSEQPAQPGPGEGGPTDAE